MIATAATADVSVTWLLLRSTGVIALALLTVSVVLGIAGPAIRRPAHRLASITAHSTAAATGVLLLVGHIVFAIADSYVDVSPLAVVVPGVSAWEPVWIGLGAAAVDLLIILTLTASMRRRIPLSWRKFHLLAYPAWALAWGHALTAGTDAASRPMAVMAIVSFTLVALAAAVRLVPRPSGRAAALQPSPGSRA